MDPLRNFKTLVKNAKGEEEWIIPLSSFDEVAGKWLFVSQKTGKAYYASDLFLQSINPKLTDLFMSFRDNAIMAQGLHTTGIFMHYWIGQMVHYNALYYADEKRIQYLAFNLFDDTPRKNVGKIMKQSEEAYQKAFDEYLKIFEEY